MFLKKDIYSQQDKTLHSLQYCQENGTFIDQILFEFSLHKYNIIYND